LIGEVVSNRATDVFFLGLFPRFSAGELRQGYVTIRCFAASDAIVMPATRRSTIEAALPKHPSTHSCPSPEQFDSRIAAI
jgi:hypothetical protein